MFCNPDMATLLLSAGFWGLPAMLHRSSKEGGTGTKERTNRDETTWTGVVAPCARWQQPQLTLDVFLNNFIFLHMAHVFKFTNILLSIIRLMYYYYVLFIYSRHNWSADMLSTSRSSQRLKQGLCFTNGL